MIFLFRMASAAATHSIGVDDSIRAEKGVADAKSPNDPAYVNAPPPEDKQFFPLLLVRRNICIPSCVTYLERLILS